jgi:peroxiredoxin
MLGVLLSIFLCVGCASDNLAPVGQPRQHAPNFSLSSLNGQRVTLSQMAGKVVLLDFSATWCVPCRQGLAHLQSVHDDPSLAAKGLVVLEIDEEEDASTVKSFIQSTGYSFPVLLDSDRSMGDDYHANSLPTSVIIGRDGTVRAVISGWTQQTPQQIGDAINAAISEPTRP